MNNPSRDPISLGTQFADEFPDLGLPWSATEAPDPRLVILNLPLARELGLDPVTLQTSEGVRFLIGNAVAESSRSVAQVYAGHQFGQFTPRLGDGRAVLLGELTKPDGSLVDIHLKGSGPTPFSRSDGYAALGPMLREFVISEAMAALGIPTTRSLAVTTTGSMVRRERILPGAVLTRVAASHIRVGSFEFAKARGNTQLLQRLVDHAIERHYPALVDSAAPPLAHLADHRADTPVDHVADQPVEPPTRDRPQSRAEALLYRVIATQADLVAQWMGVGFIHGVMNTDNMTISGETIDYGPCAFIDAYDPKTVFSSIDGLGRYSYENQPRMAKWNLERFSESLLPLLGQSEEDALSVASAALATFEPAYRAAWARVARRKLGLAHTVRLEDATDLIGGLLELAQGARADFTLLFRALTDDAVSNTPMSAPRGVDANRDTRSAAHADLAQPSGSGLTDLLGADEAVKSWLAKWRMHDPDRGTMASANPVYTPRNHLVDEALDAAVAGDMQPFTELLSAVSEPYSRQVGFEAYERPDPNDTGFFLTYCGT